MWIVDPAGALPISRGELRFEGEAGLEESIAGVGIAVGVEVGVSDEVAVGVIVGEFVGVFVMVKVGEAVDVSVIVGVGVIVGVSEGVGEMEGVYEGVAVKVGVGDASISPGRGAGMKEFCGERSIETKSPRMISLMS